MDNSIVQHVKAAVGNVKNVIVAGYFDRHNLGDDLFHEVWQYIFSKEKLKSHRVQYVGLDELRVCQDLSTSDVLIFAGGDVLNYYFLSELKNILHRFQFKGQLYAFSVGIPYQVVIVDGLLDQFNFIMCRAKGDAFNLRRRFGENHVRYFPDLSVYMSELFGIQKSKNNYLGLSREKVFNQRLSVGVFLARTIFEKNLHYKEVVKKIAATLDKIVTLTLPGSHGFELFLIPFNTNGRNAFEDDRLINQDVWEQTENKESIHLMNRRLSVEEMFFTFKYQLDMVIPMRYHAHMYSIVAQVPLVSMYTTRKVQNLLLDTGLSRYSYHFPLNEDDLPIDFDQELFVEKFVSAYNDRSTMTTTMKNYVETCAPLQQFESTLETLIEDPIDKVQIKTRKYPLMTITNVIESLVRYIWSEQGKVVNDKDVALVADQLYKGQLTFLTLMGPEQQWIHRKDKLSDFLAALACFGLIQIPYPKYHFGMAEKILTSKFHAKNEFMWVWGDYQSNNEKFFIENPTMRRSYFNATFVGIEDLKGCHRSGWQYCLDNLMSFHSDTSNLIFDNYIDRTFHWAHDVYKYTKIIPFKKPWCGFIHHTFDETYSPYNVPNLFRNDTFLQSLSTCFALFTLSQDLATKLKVLLQQMGVKHIHVKSFVHPTETSQKLFSIDRFVDNDKRKVIQIGAWLRDTYAIYKLGRYKSRELLMDSNRLHVQKAILKGRHMNNYFKPEKFGLTYLDPVNNLRHEYKFHSGELENFTNNKFVIGLAVSVHDEWNSVEIIDTLNNEQYDELLSENIVFLKLVDASAVNTIIECIVRCTPILVNHHAAVEEMLGVDYPFYYDDLVEATVKLNDLDLIKRTNKYLVNLNKSKFSMDYFMRDMDNWFNEMGVCRDVPLCPATT